MKHLYGLCLSSSSEYQILRTFPSKVRGESVIDFSIIFWTKNLSKNKLKSIGDNLY